MTSHTSFWDCFEKETRKRRAKRLTGDSTYDTGRPELIEIYECPECGRWHVVEVFNRNTEVEDANFYGLKQSYVEETEDIVSDVLSDYNID